MPNISDTAIQQQSARRRNVAKRLIQAAALASSLIPLGAVPAESAIINCVTDGGGSGTSSCASGGGQGTYSPASGSNPGTGSNTWKFFSDGTFTPEKLLYTVEIFGDPTSTFTLNTHDEVVSQSSTALNLSAFPGAQCIPIFNADNCAYFSVEVLSGTPSWDDGFYTMLIHWFTNADPVSQPPDNGTNRILKAEFGTAFTASLIDSDYDPAPTPTDPALGGRGDTFSNFLPATNVTNAPEPTALMLFGAAAAAALVRRRRKR